MRGQLCVVILAASFGAALDGASLTFSGYARIEATEYSVDTGEYGEREPFFHQGSCEKSAQGSPLHLVCEYLSGSDYGDSAFLEVTGFGNRSYFELSVFADPLFPYYDEHGFIWVDQVLEGSVVARLHGLYYITGGRGTTTFRAPYVASAPFHQAYCRLTIDGVQAADNCFGEFTATFGKPFYMYFEVGMYLNPGLHTTYGGARVFASHVSSGQRSYPLYVVPEGATGGLVVVGLAGLAGWGRWRRRRDGLESLRGCRSSD